MDQFLTDEQLAELAAEEAQLARAPALEGDKLWDAVAKKTPKRDEEEEKILDDDKLDFVDAVVKAAETAVDAADADVATKTEALNTLRRAQQGTAQAETQPGDYSQLQKPDHVSKRAYKLLAEISPYGHQLFLHELPEENGEGHLKFGGWMKDPDLRRYGWQGRNSTRFSMNRRDMEEHRCNFADLPASTHVYMPKRKKEQYDYLLNCVNHYATKDAVRFNGQSRKAMRADAKRKVDEWWDIEKPKTNPFTECFGGSSSAFDGGD